MRHAHVAQRRVVEAKRLRPGQAAARQADDEVDRAFAQAWHRTCAKSSVLAHRRRHGIGVGQRAMRLCRRPQDHLALALLDMADEAVFVFLGIDRRRADIGLRRIGLGDDQARRIRRKGRLDGADKLIDGTDRAAIP